MRTTSHVRAGTADDVSAVGALLERVFVGGGFTSPASARGLRRSLDGAPGTAWFVAGDPASGMPGGSVYLATATSGAAEVALADEAEIQLLAVEEPARGRGIGEALVRRCLAQAAAWHCRRVVLSTQPAMHPAQRLYVRCGFRPVPERDWERNGVARLVYVCAVGG